MTDPVPSKEQNAISLAVESVRQLERDLAEARRENVRWENAHKILISDNDRLRKQVDELSIHAEKWVKRALDSAPEAAAMRALWNKAVIIQDDNRATVAFETAEEAEAAFDYLQELGSMEQPAPEPPAEWQPIETAPKDGTPILGHVLPPRMQANLAGPRVVKWAGEYGMWSMPGISGLTCSHWMPVPKAPSQPPGAGQ